MSVGGMRSTGGVSAVDDVRVASVLRGMRGDGEVWDRRVVNLVWIWDMCVWVA